MTYPQDFLNQIDEAWNAPFSGWDFSWLEGKHTEAAPAWDYLALARERMRGVISMLDMDTGGGEILSSLAPFPPDTRATESWEQNIAVARARLEPLGIRVFSFTENPHLPFEDFAFDLALNRHGAYDPLELRRILKPGGILLTQQVGGQNQMRINQLLQDEVHFEYSYWTPAYAVEQLEAAGFAILQAREDFPEVNFYTLGALVYYLKVISWQVEGFTPQAYLEKLHTIYTLIQQEGKLVTHEHRFLIEARSPK